MAPNGHPHSFVSRGVGGDHRGSRRRRRRRPTVAAGALYGGDGDYGHENERQEMGKTRELTVRVLASSRRRGEARSRGNRRRGARWPTLGTSSMRGLWCAPVRIDAPGRRGRRRRSSETSSWSSGSTVAASTMAAMAGSGEEGEAWGGGGGGTGELQGGGWLRSYPSPGLVREGR